jgi:hypothetical protein
MTPHYYRRSAIHTVLLFLISIIVASLIFSSCAPKNGCPAVYKNRLQGYGWIKCLQTKKVSVLDKDGAIVCTYIDNK